MSEGLIKREDAINQIYKLKKTVIKHDVLSYRDGLSDALEIVQDLPSADRPQGYWTKTDVATYRCSECGKKQIADDENELNYCCCCGSKNKLRYLKGADDE